MKLLELEPKGRFVFVGDTHGDLTASIKVVEMHLNIDTKIIFLGDYVDRGSDSKGNINYLLKKKAEDPDKIHLLQGNHETYCTLELSPADFWKNLKSNEKEKYHNIFKKFPLAVSVGDIVALHGALPNIKKIEDINKIGEGELDKNWMAMLWGDFNEIRLGEGDESYDNRSGRPIYGKEYFNKIMKNLNKNVLIRSHQSDANQVMFNNKCLTIFTSSAYWVKRTIAIADFNKKKRIMGVDDLVIEKI